ncbi:hypothetical protein TRFO_40808 [Tritrichomonas foetus]|uniref:SP-RING-type domain-containing protein n=1 Tax=Tritrichomonas foetus TaxID=1144522 RepID=A0A1J4IZW9_9EUKA|nr:hypothetical protein TRFO_40808 [Tritrichomonas foetus]|eukprot:OHS92888.1 hypothetical protein TRFO_40808 [Tritrichomonas foetus]
MSKPVSPIYSQHVNPPAKIIPRQSISVLELSRKRRSGSCDSPSIGQPFINPVNRVTRSKPRRSFFRTASNQSDQNSVQSLVNSLSPSQAFRISMMLRIAPPNLNTLRDFVSRVSPQDQTMMDTIRNAIYSIIRKQEDTAPVDYGFVDCRFSAPSTPIEIINGPINLGETSVDFAFQIPQIPSGLHVVVQPFILGQTPPTIRWPSSLRILVNEHQAKPPGVFPFSHVDLTTFGSGSIVRILCGIEQAKFLLFIRFAQYMSYHDMVLKIQNEKPAVNDNLRPSELSLYSPMSGKVMKHPGRGIQCGHTQCFDLKEYLERCSITQQWLCPICRKHVSPGDLVYSHKTKSILYNLTKASGITAHFPPTLNNVNFTSIPSMTPINNSINSNIINNMNNNLSSNMNNDINNNLSNNMNTNLNNMNNNINNWNSMNMNNFNMNMNGMNNGGGINSGSGNNMFMNNNSNHIEINSMNANRGHNEQNSNGLNVNVNNTKVNPFDGNDMLGNVSVFDDHGDSNFGFQFPEEEDGWNF